MVRIVLLASALLVAGKLSYAHELCSFAGDDSPPLAGAAPAGGAVYLRSATGEPVFAPALATEVDIQVSGVLVRAVVRQTFWNDSGGWQDGVYLFPLPERAAVQALYLRIGDRFIEGQIQEREAAREIYRSARQAGKKASLVEQQRPNVFSLELANIGPGEEVEVVLEYQEVLRYDQGSFELRFPLVVAPRFEADRASITADVAYAAAGSDLWNPVYLVAEVAPGFALAQLDSPSHEIEAQPLPGQRWQVVLSDAPADRDFVLRFAPVRDEEPVATVLAEEWDGHFYVLLLVLPPQDLYASTRRRLGRETLLVIDTSGSMGGASLRQARDALQLALESLAPADAFNLIEFNSSTHQLFSESRRASVDNLELASDYVRGLEAQGGTFMRPALELALQDDGLAPIRQIVFITDGAVGNEQELFGLLQDRLERSRLFTVGIGSAPNSYFMRRAARFGRGTYTFIGTPDEVGLRMGELFSKLERPVLGGLDVRWPEGAEMWPERIPDLYAGEPLVVAARIPRAAGEVWIRGRTAERAWEVRVALVPELHAGIHQLWARNKIAALLDEAGDAASARDPVVDVALEHHLVSRFTSLVAVDVTPSRPRGAESAMTHLPLHVPHGWDPSRVPGLLPQGSTPAPLLFLGGVGLLGAALATLYTRISAA